MREPRQSGSEGGGAGSNRLSLPLLMETIRRVFMWSYPSILDLVMGETVDATDRPFVTQSRSPGALLPPLGNPPGPEWGCGIPTAPWFSARAFHWLEQRAV